VARIVNYCFVKVHADDAFGVHGQFTFVEWPHPDGYFDRCHRGVVSSCTCMQVVVKVVFLCPFFCLSS